VTFRLDRAAPYSIKVISVEDMLDRLIEMRQIVECDNCGAPRQEIGCECAFCKEIVQ
jgi:hypothetical protein